MSLSRLCSISRLLPLLVAALAPAQASTTLPQAVEQAIMRNPEVLARYHEFRAVEEEQAAARGNWLPRLDAQAFIGKEKQDYPTTGTTPWYNHPGASVQLRQLLFDGFATWNDVKRLGYTKLARYYDLLGTSDDIALQTTQAYIDVLRYQELLRLAAANWATHKELVGQIESRVKAGVGKRVDLEQAGGRLALAHSNWLTESSNLHDVTQRYKRLVGFVPAEHLAPLPDVGKTLPIASNPLPEIVAANAGFRASVAGLRAARAETNLRRASHLPNIELQVAQNWDRNLDNSPGNYNSTQARVVLNYNLFRGGSDQARVRQSTELYYAATDLRDKSCRDVVQIASIAINDTRALAEQIGYLEQHELSTQKALTAYRQQFDIGQRTLLDLLDSENELFEARRSVTRTRFDLELARFRVLAAGNRLLPALALAPIAQEAPEEERKDAPLEDQASACAQEYYRAPLLDTAATQAKHASVVRPDPLLSVVAKPTAAPSPSGEAQLEIQLNAWAKAWESKDLKAYMDFYSVRFVPENQRSREHWSKFRQTYVQKPGTLSLTIKQIEFKRFAEDKIETSFQQSYRSDDYQDDVRKTLLWAKEDGQWRIVREYAIPPTLY